MKTELIMLRDRIKGQDRLVNGLCLEANSMSLPDGGYALRGYIWSHRPKRGKHYCVGYRYKIYFWPPEEIKPRLDWLNYQIKYYWILNILRRH